MASNMKTKVKALYTPDIKLCKVTGPANGKSANYKVGDYVNLSVKKGVFANSVSKPGTKHKAIIMYDRTLTNSDTYHGITGIAHNAIHVAIIDQQKKQPLCGSFQNLAIHKRCEEIFAELDRKAKRKPARRAMRYL